MHVLTYQIQRFLHLWFSVEVKSKSYHYMIVLTTSTFSSASLAHASTHTLPLKCFLLDQNESVLASWHT